MGILLFWLAYFCGSKFLRPFLPAFNIFNKCIKIYFSDLSFYLYFILISKYRENLKKISSFIFILPILIGIIFLVSSDFLSNYLLRTSSTGLEMSISELINFSIESLQNIFINLDPLNKIQMNTDYCFDFDMKLFLDQSFAMRLSKAIFVISAVLLGPYKYGVGFGNCIGNAADNLYIRLLSDGGILFLILIITFYILLLLDRKLSKLKGWITFILSLILLSFFYDTLYFSRVAPLVFLNISIAFAIVKNKYIIES